MTLPTTHILDVRLNPMTMADAAAQMIAWASSGTPHTISTCTVYTLMISREQPDVRAALDAASMVTTDGMPLVWLARRQGHPRAERVYGPDLLLEVCRLTAGTDIRHYFWGGSPGVAAKLVARLEQQFPRLKIAGYASPPFAPAPPDPDPAVVAQIRAARPHIVWIGLGSPKQDLWMHAYAEALNVPVLIGVGAAFDFLSGAKRQAPRWMRISGLEWLFRLLSEPRRLWQRYVIYNTRFALAVLRRR